VTNDSRLRRLPPGKIAEREFASSGRMKLGALSLQIRDDQLPLAGEKDWGGPSLFLTAFCLLAFRFLRAETERAKISSQNRKRID